MNTLTVFSTKGLRIVLFAGVAVCSAGAAHAQNYWVGATDTIYTKPANWSLGRVPSFTDDAIIQPVGTTVPAFTSTGTPTTATVASRPSLSAALGIGTARTLTINSGARLRLNPQSELDLFGNLVNNGSLVGAGSLDIKSPTPAPTTANPSPVPTLTAHTLSGSGNALVLNDLMLEQNAPTTLSMPVSLNRQLSLTSNLTTTTAGPLTLLSTPTVTAFVVNNDNLTGTGATGVVMGTVTVQRAIDASVNAGRGYRHYSAPVSNTTVADLAAPGFTPEISAAETYNSSRNPPATTPFPTVYGYDQALVNRDNSSPDFDKGFFAPISLNTPLVPGRGYTVNLLGTVLVDFVGSLNNGNISVNVARNAAGTLHSESAGWQLLGNPYPAPLDYSKVAAADRAGLDNAIYIYSSTSQYGGFYRAFTFGADGVTPAFGNPIIPVGQSFFAHVTTPGTTSTFTFRNAQRLTTSDGTTFQRTAAKTRPQLEMALRSSDKTVQDMLGVYFESGSTAGVDPGYDAVKMLNNNGMFLGTLAADGQELAIDGRPLPTDQLTIPLHVAVSATGTYTLQAAKLANMSDLHVYLHDKRLGSFTDLAQQPEYTFNLSTANNNARFELVFSKQAMSTAAPAALTEQVDLYPSPAKGVAFLELPASLSGEAIVATLVDAMGRTVRTTNLPAQGEATHQLGLAGLAKGIYVLRLQTSAGIVAKRLAVE